MRLLFLLNRRKELRNERKRQRGKDGDESRCFRLKRKEKDDEARKKDGKYG